MISPPGTAKLRALVRRLGAFGSGLLAVALGAPAACTGMESQSGVSGGVAPGFGAVGAGPGVSASGSFGAPAGSGGQGGSSGTAGRGGSAGAGVARAGSSAGGAAGAYADGGAPEPTPTLADDYPGDVGIADDPDVVWAESFEQASVAEFLARYESHQNEGGMVLDGSRPSGSSGQTSLRLTSTGTGENATDFYKNLGDGYEELFVRYYARYEANVPWHHTGVWIGGHAPASDWPDPQAGLRPNGDDRFSIALEPMDHGPTPRLDFYNYWMTMHSWMDEPEGDTAYYGNSLIHQPGLVARDAWQCIELHVVLNPDPASAAGAELALWVDDALIVRFADESPLGYWIKDKFCPDSATGTECTDYRPAEPELVPLELRLRSSDALKLNALWPQNYITDEGGGSVWYDDLVLAKRRIGCLR